MQAITLTLNIQSPMPGSLPVPSNVIHRVEQKQNKKK